MSMQSWDITHTEYIEIKICLLLEAIVCVLQKF